MQNNIKIVYSIGRRQPNTEVARFVWTVWESFIGGLVQLGKHSAAVDQVIKTDQKKVVVIGFCRFLWPHDILPNPSVEEFLSGRKRESKIAEKGTFADQFPAVQITKSAKRKNYYNDLGILNRRLYRVQVAGHASIARGNSLSARI